MVGATPFKITGMSDVACNFLQHDDVTGDDHGGIALSTTRVFYSGDEGTGSFSRTDLSGGEVLKVRWEAMLTDLATGNVYALADDTGPLARPGGTATQLLRLRDDGRLDDSVQPVRLSTSIPALSGISSVGLFSGWSHGYVYNTRVYRINYDSGAVTDLGELDSFSARECENWTYHGIAETQGSTLTFLFSDPVIGIEILNWNDRIARVDVSTGNVTEVLLVDGSNFTDQCNIHVDADANRWYWKREVDGNEIVGFCDATFMQSGSDFRVSGMTESNCQQVDITAVSGDDDGGFAVSSTHVLYTGEQATARTTLALGSVEPVPVIHEAMVTELRTSQVYVLGDRGRPLQCGGGRVSQLIPLDSTGRVSGTAVDLSDVIEARTTPICSTAASSAIGIFAGYDGIAIHNGTNVFWVSLAAGNRGQVRDLGPLTMPPRRGCETWGYWGVAEFFGDRLHLAFASTDNTIKRIRVPEGTTENVATFSDINDLCGFVINTDPSQSRWYWHNENDSQLATGGTGPHPEFIGYCPATFTLSP